MIAHEELTGKIIKAFYKVHRILGFGFLENVYKNALLIELRKEGLNCDSEKDIDVLYDGNVVGHYRPDIIVENLIILELKAVANLKLEHEFQLINYLKATGTEVGLLLNFGHSAEFKRKVFSKNYHKDN